MISKIVPLLKSIGLNDKEILVYSAILPLGSASIRIIAGKTNINRGTVHDILNILTDKGLISDERHGSKRKFIVESPEKVLDALDAEMKKIETGRKKIAEAMPMLMSFYAKQGGRPSVEYFDEDSGIKVILEDVIAISEKLKEKEYYVYSSKSVRDYLYKLYPNFTKDKVKKKIRTRVIALGGGGDPEFLKLAERRWLVNDAPAYIIIYGPKIALISIAEDGKPFGVVVNDDKITSTQRILFEVMWDGLKMQKANIKM